MSASLRACNRAMKAADCTSTRAATRAAALACDCAADEKGEAEGSSSPTKKVRAPAKRGRCCEAGWGTPATAAAASCTASIARDTAVSASNESCCSRMGAWWCDSAPAASSAVTAAASACRPVRTKCEGMAGRRRRASCENAVDAAAASSRGAADANRGNAATFADRASVTAISAATDGRVGARSPRRNEESSCDAQATLLGERWCASATSGDVCSTSRKADGAWVSAADGLGSCLRGPTAPTLAARSRGWPLPGASPMMPAVAT